MSYLTVEEFKSRYPNDEVVRLSDPGNPLSTGNDQRILLALNSAYSLINSYRAKVGDRAPWVVSDWFKQIEATLARNMLAIYADQDDLRYKNARDAISWLAAYAKGDVIDSTQVAIDPTPIPDSSAEIGYQLGNYRFDRNRPICWG